MARPPFHGTFSASIAVLLYTAIASAADVTCYVDSVLGSDTNAGTSEAAAWKSPAKISSTCTIVKFKRGSEFTVAKGKYAVDLMTLRNITTLTNYGDPSLPLPKFVKQREVSSGAMLVSYMGNITIDGLFFSGSRSDASMSNLVDGICIMLGANSKLLNSELTLCDIGVMTTGDNIQVLKNYIHDLSISVDAAPGVDPNAVGGAEGIFVNSSHVEVAYNRFINCSTAAQWVSGTSKRCDGGATEVTVPYGKEVTDVRIHHNFSYRSCGFFEVSSMFQPSGTTDPYVKGILSNSAFYDNVMIDSGWLSLLQINNTRLSNVRWENNTIVHHDLGKDADGTDLNTFQGSGIQALAFNDTSSGVTGGGVIESGDIFWTNNLWYFDPKLQRLPSSSDPFLKNINQATNLVVTSDPGFVKLAGTTNPSDFDLVAGSIAIDKGTNLAEIESDFLDRPAPVGTLDIGAFEYGSSSGTGGASGGDSGGAGLVAATGGQAGSNATVARGGADSTSTDSTFASQGGSAGGAGGVANSSSNAGAPGDESGCSCRLVTAENRTSRMLSLLALGATIALRRRRSSSK